MTAGLDSRVTAVALRELGIAARGFTWGEPDWDDVRGGKDLAEQIGLPHELVGVEWLDDGEAMRELDRQVRWTEGAVPVGFARLAWPADMGGFVTGAGGEVGRAFYYAGAPDEADPGDVLAGLLAARLPRGEASARLGTTLREWVGNAERAGHAGLGALDVVYGEERVRRWLRGMLPRLAAPMIPAFATPEVARALASLPLKERMTSGFHRGFLEKRAPELVPVARRGQTSVCPRRSGCVAATDGGRPQAAPWRLGAAVRRRPSSGSAGASIPVSATGSPIRCSRRRFWSIRSGRGGRRARASASSPATAMPSGWCSRPRRRWPSPRLSRS